MGRNKLHIIVVTLLSIFINAPILAKAQDGQVSTAFPIGGMIYVNANIGRNNNDGIQSSPLQTLSEAAKRINSAKGEGALQYIFPKVCMVWGKRLILIR